MPTDHLTAALIRHMLRTGEINEADINAMSDDCMAHGHDDAAHEANVLFVESQLPAQLANDRPVLRIVPNGGNNGE